jgi:predicted RNA-binding protein with PIN domain
MALLRILVDGYSLLHNWPELAPGKARHSAMAREELVRRLTEYHDATGTAVTVVFDGAGERGRPSEMPSTRGMEVLFSRSGQTADDIIERAAARLAQLGEVLVVTDDYAERDTVIAFGAMAVSCDVFLGMMRDATDDMQRDLKNHNRRERIQYRRRAGEK